MSVQCKYELTLRAKTRDITEEAGEIEDNINSFMKNMGFQEEITIATDIPLMMTTDRLLTEKEQQEVINMMNKTLVDQGKEKMECCNIRLMEAAR